MSSTDTTIQSRTAETKSDLRPHIFLLVAERDPLPSDFMDLFFRSGSPDCDSWFAAVDSLKHLELLVKHDTFGWLTDQGKWLREDVNKYSREKQARLDYVAGFITSLETFNEYFGDATPPDSDGEPKRAESVNPAAGSAQQHTGDTLQQLFLMVEDVITKHGIKLPGMVN